MATIKSKKPTTTFSQETNSKTQTFPHPHTKFLFKSWQFIWHLPTHACEEGCHAGCSGLETWALGWNYEKKNRAGLITRLWPRDLPKTIISFPLDFVNFLNLLTITKSSLSQSLSMLTWAQCSVLIRCSFHGLECTSFFPPIFPQYTINKVIAPTIMARRSLYRFVLLPNRPIPDFIPSDFLF